MAASGSPERWTWREVDVAETHCGAADFLSGVSVWLRRPQVVNRRLVGATLVRGDWEKVEEVAKAARRETGKAVERRNCVFVRELLPRSKSVPLKRERVSVCLSAGSVDVTFDPSDDIIACGCGSYKLRYSSGSPNRISLLVFCASEKQTKSATPDGVNTPTVQKYAGYSTPDEVTTPTVQKPAGYSTPDGVTTPTVEWLGSTLLPKVVQWSEESGRGKVSTVRQEPLVSLAKYCTLYRELRERYAPTLIQKWPEATDPHKFVYEDISIATYLLLLWEKERDELQLSEKQTFIDLGCGNGLLVYLLTAEGYKGKGIDLRRRKIWSCYGDGVDLEVCSLTPSDLTVFPEFDWLIGNHSDELTPWIPLMAARSSYKTRYFVLPCCPHDFDSKYRRPDTNRSQYSSYLAYVRLIGETVGFKVHEDTLRIPSSKRVCQVGCERWYSEDEEREVERKRENFLRERCRLNREGVAKCVREKPVISSTADLLESSVHTTASGGCGPGRVSGGCGLGRGSGGCDPDVVCGGCGQGGVSGGCGPGNFSPGCGQGGVWSNGFVPRSPTDQTRNCSRVGRSLQHLIVQRLTTLLLQTENWVAISGDGAPESDQSPLTSANFFTTTFSLPVATAAGTLSTTADTHAGTLSADTLSVSTTADTGSTTALSLSVSTTADTLSVSTTADTLSVSTAAERLPSSSTVSVSLNTATTPPSLSQVSLTLSDSSRRLAAVHCHNHGRHNAEDVIIKSDDITREAQEDDTTTGGRGRESGEEQTAIGDEASGSCMGSLGNTCHWNLGGRMSLSKAASHFDSSALKQLKRECGGLQTLLRNHHQVFQVSGGFVQLRNWAVTGAEHGPRRPAKQRSSKDARRLVKTKPCWFYHHHPQGCPRDLSRVDCPYAHGSAELRERPKFETAVSLFDVVHTKELK